MSKAKEQRPRACCSRFAWEFKGATFFGLEESNGETLDVQNSFAPLDRLSRFVRVSFLLWSVTTLIYDLWAYPEENVFIFFGYLTHWTWAFSIAYQLVAYWLVLSRCGSKRLEQPNGGGRPGFLVRLQWVLYSIAAPGELVVMLLYWSMDYDGQSITYLNMFKHGIIGVLIWLDGLAIATIPVRIKHLPTSSSRLRSRRNRCPIQTSVMLDVRINVDSQIFAHVVQQTLRMICKRRSSQRFGQKI